MILDAKPDQFRVSEDGMISFQAQPTNPLPGVAIAKLVKGEHILKPHFELLPVDVIKDVEAGALLSKLREAFDIHVKSVMEDLVNLQNVEGLSEGGAEIAKALYDALGILPREELESAIATLDTETRRPVRQKKIKLGPVLVFLYTLNKPAAVRLRAMLWSLYHGKDLPAQVPNDGMVSMTVDPEAIDPVYYRSIGYPVYGRRAIRVDMLDRLISAIYDSADKGKFQAKHEMAEWLGCSIDDLYLVLEAMGHVKDHEPALEGVKAEEESAVATPEPQESVVVVMADEDAVQQAEGADVTSDAGEVKAEAEAEKEGDPSSDKAPEVQVKPELATFRLKRGRANRSGNTGRRPFKKPDQAKKGNSFAESKRKKKPAKKAKVDRGPRVISTGPERKLEDSPFAILEQLKNKS